MLGQHGGKEFGDGLGYDIVSFDENGAELLLEVKTTNAGILMPFFITANELAVAERIGDAYRLYRVFDFSTSPRAFATPFDGKRSMRHRTVRGITATVANNAASFVAPA
jgi:hypothetical protein